MKQTHEGKPDSRTPLAPRHLEFVHPRPNGGRRAVAIAFLLLALILSLATLPRAGATPGDATQTGTIAFVNATTGDEIRLVEPDGSQNRQLWAHGQPDPLEIYDVWSLDWRPDGSEIAFASNHENYCSINDGDIFVVGSQGGNYRRLTQGPSCAGLAAYPKGTVRIPVYNSSIFGDTFNGFVYFQGAPGLLQVNLAPGQSTMLEFTGVADFGDGELQLAAMIAPPYRAVSIASVSTRCPTPASASPARRRKRMASGADRRLFLGMRIKLV